jgi:hypothetical protein
VPRAKRVSIDVRHISLLNPGGGELSLGQLPGVQVLVLLRDGHRLPCQHHLAQVSRSHDNPWVGLVLVGFGPADLLVALAGDLGWSDMVLADPQLLLYRRLGIGRAPRWRTRTASAGAVSVRAHRVRQQVTRPDEAARQLGGDAIMVAGTVTTVWRSRSPDDRPTPAEVHDAARSAVEATR